MKYVTQFIKEEDGIGIVELILILVILIALVLTLRRRLKGSLKVPGNRLNKDTKDILK